MVVGKGLALMIKKNLEVICFLIVIVGAVVGALAYFATAKDLNLVAARLDQKILSDQIDQTQRRIWQLEDRYKGAPPSTWPNQRDRAEYRQLKERVEKLKLRYKRSIEK